MTSWLERFSWLRGSKQPPPDLLVETLVIGFIALVPRLFVAIAWSHEPVWDGFYYHFGAERIAAGLGYSEDVLIGGRLVWKPWCHYPVGYSAFLGALYFVFGNGLLVAPIANAVIGTATAMVVHRLALTWLSPSRARLAGALAALHPGLIAYSALVMNELLSALLLLAAAWVATKQRSRWHGSVLGGVVLGLGVLVRPTSLLAAPLLGLTQPGPLRRQVLRGLMSTAVAVAVVLPWTARNCSIMDGCAFVSTNGGWNLAIGAITETGRFQTLRAEDGCRVVTGQVQQDRCWADVGLAKIRSDPAAWIARMPQKLAQTFDHESFAIEYLHQANPRQWPEPRRDSGRRFLTTAHRLLLVLAALGVIARVSPSRDRLLAGVVQGALVAALAILTASGFASDAHPFYRIAVAIPLIALLPLPGRPSLGGVGAYAAGLLATTVATHAVFFGDDRYHLVITPALCLLAAAALRPPADECPSEDERPAQGDASPMSQASPSATR